MIPSPGQNSFSGLTGSHALMPAFSPDGKKIVYNDTDNFGGHNLVVMDFDPATNTFSNPKQVFIDMKLHDIGNTVARGIESIARLGATFTTVHAYPQTMHAAVEARA